VGGSNVKTLLVYLIMVLLEKVCRRENFCKTFACVIDCVSIGVRVTQIVTNTFEIFVRIDYILESYIT